jgi:hypothetical protein
VSEGFRLLWHSRETVPQQEFDYYCAYTLLFLFNPIVTSLRGIQQASELQKVQKKLGCPRASLGSLSEAVEVFDPDPVKQIAGELTAQLEPLANDRSFPEVKHLVTARVRRCALAAWPRS